MVPMATEDTIRWSNREFNTEADGVCNIILNNPIRCYKYTIATPEYYYNKRPNLFLQSDGACKGGEISSTRWHIKAVSPTLARGER